MRKLIPLMLVALPLMLIIAIGCGDDETTTITEFDTVTVTDTVTDTLIEPVPILAKGYALLVPSDPVENIYPAFHVNLYGTEPVRPVIDSVIVGDSACEINTTAYWTYGDLYAWASYDNPGDTQRYISGDTIDFSFYAYDAVSTGQVTLLDNEADVAVLVDAATPDTVDIDAGFTVVWNKVPSAEWYGLYVQYRHGGTGEIIYHNTYAYTYDTTYSVAGTETQFDGFIRVYVVSTTGPVSDAAMGNITGEGVTGTIYSYSQAVLSVTYVGTGTPVIPPPAKGLPVVREDILTDAPVNARDIIDAITSR